MTYAQCLHLFSATIEADGRRGEPCERNVGIVFIFLEAAYREEIARLTVAFLFDTDGTG